MTDWQSALVTRAPTSGAGPPQWIYLPVRTGQPGGVTGIAAGCGYVWATVPDDRAVWRIDEQNPEKKRRIGLHYRPWGVAVDDRCNIWVSVRARDWTPNHQ